MKLVGRNPEATFIRCAGTRRHDFDVRPVIGDAPFEDRGALARLLQERE